MNKIFPFLLLGASFLPWVEGAIEPLKVASVTASSSAKKTLPEKAIDRDLKDDSRWISQVEEQSWLEMKLEKAEKIGGLFLLSGYKGTSPIENFSVQFWSNGAWVDVPSALIQNNKEPALAVVFDSTVEVQSDRLRLVITKTPDRVARVVEVILWPLTQEGLPDLKTTFASKYAPYAGEARKSQASVDIPLIFLNQSGFNLGKPKRFTAPTLKEDTPFIIRAVDGHEALAKGMIHQQRGDFSDFNPRSEGEFVVEAGGLRSVPFRIGAHWLERVTTQNSIDFMIDSRHYVGNYRNVCQGSFGWRDDHHFGWELHTLVPQYLSNPSAYDRLPRQIVVEAPSESTKGKWGKLLPPSNDAPDMVKLIHWGADVIVTQKLSHELLKSQLAYFLYAWPKLKKFLPEQNYLEVKNYAFSTWALETCDRKYPYDVSLEHNLLSLKTKIGSTKGEYPPGFSVEPNLLMYEIARRENIEGAERFLKAAQNQVQWMIDQLDWNDPLNTKGQRMSEFLTLTGMCHFLKQYPDQAPKGLQNKIQAWVSVVIRRSDNMWDFRKLDDDAQWTPMGDKPTMWNEPGNVVGLPACLMAARPFVTDPLQQKRCDEIAWAHFDNMFGRNPSGRHFSYDAPREIEGVEFGWYKYHHGGIGQLAEARFVLDGSPKNDSYPFQPENGPKGWTEGWIQHNNPFNLSLAYLAHLDTQIEGEFFADELEVRLVAPLNYDPLRKEEALVRVSSSDENGADVTLVEDGTDSSVFKARLKWKPWSEKNGLQAQGAQVKKIILAYGMEPWGRKVVVVMP